MSARNHVRAEETKRATEVVKGCVARSLTTRGKNVGVQGTVRWVGEDSYRPSYAGTAYKVGIKPLDKVERIDVEQIDDSEIDMVADRWLAQATWRTLTALPH